MSTSTYHHRNLSAALVRAVLELPYRDYPDCDPLLSAVATVGYRELAESFAAEHRSPSTPDDLAAVAVAYVQFALRRPALFRVMSGRVADRVRASVLAVTAASGPPTSAAGEGPGR